MSSEGVFSTSFDFSAIETSNRGFGLRCEFALCDQTSWLLHSRRGNRVDRSARIESDPNALSVLPRHVPIGTEVEGLLFPDLSMVASPATA